MACPVWQVTASPCPIWYLTSGLRLQTVSTTVKKIHRSLGVTIANGTATATLDVPVSLKNVFSMSVPGPMPTENSVTVSASITPSVNVKDAVLTVPDFSVFPKKGNPANKYTFGGNDPNILDNPPWVATFIGVSDANPYFNATAFHPSMLAFRESGR